MKTLAKSFGAFAAAMLIAVAACVALFAAPAKKAYADDEAKSSAGYFYSQLSDNELARNFYEAFEDLANKGEFKKGRIEYDLVANNVASSEQVKAYVNGADNNKLVKAYSAGRDSFYMDHPDLFYVDVFATSISAGQKENGEYVAYLDSSRVLTTYRGNINSEAAVNTAVAAYENELNKIVNGAKSAGGVVAQITYVNNYIATNNTYGFGTVVEGDRNVDTSKADFIYTSYGALVNKESVCEGYAKSFKAVMDRLGIPCVCISGSADGNKDGKYEPHMWNAVKVEGLWYAVDVTYNATGADKEQWLLIGGTSLSDTHVEDGVVSSSEYELRYPVLKPYEYGNNKDSNDMTLEASYEEGAGGNGILLNLTVSYDGKGAKKLEDEGMYLAYRYYLNTDNVESWGRWKGVVAENAVMKILMGLEEEDEDVHPVTEYDTLLKYIPSDVRYVQFALINRAPDAKIEGDVTNIPMEYAAIDEENDYCVVPTVPYPNDGYNSYNPAPAVLGTTPSNSGNLDAQKTHNIRVAFNEELELEEGKTEADIEIDYGTSRGNNFVKENSELKNIHWDGHKEITFTFTPSKMYVHNAAAYYFTVKGLVGVKSKKAPDAVRFAFETEYIVCNKIFSDGRLYMNLYGQPKMLDQSDISVTDFKDANGKYFAESQRSQLVLVASKPSADKEQTMDEVLKSETGVKDDDILASASFEIDLQLCGVVPKIPNGSYMQVQFGFPEGYEPEEEATYKIYHYKTDSVGNILGVEEIPVIVNKYGIIAKVSSFSPFTVVQLKNSSAAVGTDSKVNVYAYVNGGTGGTVKTDGNSGISEVTGSTITYDITAEDGYQVGYVRLNDNTVDPESYKSGKLTLNKSDLSQSNMLEVQFVTKQSAQSYAAKGISLTTSYTDNKVPAAPNAPSDTNVAGIVIGVIVGVMVLAAVILLLWWFLVKKKKTATAGASKQTKKTTANSSKTQAQPKPTTTASRTTTPQKPTTVSRTTTTTQRPSATTTRPTSTTQRPTSSTTRPTTTQRPSSSSSSSRPSQARRDDTRKK